MAYRILMAAMGMDIGGAETHILELAGALTARGHQVAVVSRGGARVPELEKMGVRHYTVPLHRRKDMAAALVGLARVLDREQPQIVHAHARIPALLCALLCRRRGIAFVTTAHGIFSPARGLRRLSCWGQRTLAVSRDVADHLERAFRLPRSRITLTVNGIDTARFHPQQTVPEGLGLEGDGPTVCHVSRLEGVQGRTAELLLKVLPQLERTHPGTKLLVVGGGEALERLQEQARQVNRRLGRRAAVLTGPRTDVERLVAAGDVFVGVSRAALEAMAEEKCVLLAGGQGYGGILRPEGLDRAARSNFCGRDGPLPTAQMLLADLGGALTMGQAERQRLGAWGRQVVERGCSPRRMADDCLRVYEQVWPRERRVLLSGYYGYGNAGDEAILHVLGDMLTRHGVTAAALSGCPEDTRRRHGLEGVGRVDPAALVRAVGRCGVLVSGGGSLLQDRTSTRSLLYYLAVQRLAAARGKKVMFWGSGVGPVCRLCNRRRVRAAAEGADRVSLRDGASLDALRRMGVRRPDLHLSADPVFALDPAPAGRVDEILTEAGLPAGQGFFTVALRPWPGTQGLTGQLERVCDRLYRRHGLWALFVLMQPEQDMEVTQRVRGQMKTPSLLLREELSPPELLGVLGRGELCVAMRLHALLLSARMAVPGVGLSYDPKVDACLTELGLGPGCPAQRAGAEQILERTEDVLARRTELRAQLDDRAKQLRQRVEEDLRALMELLDT